MCSRRPAHPLTLTLLWLAATAGPGCASLSRALSGHDQGQSQHAGAASAAPKGPASAADLIEDSLKKQGLAFGTDGSVEALYSYLRARHEVVPAKDARVGDVVFFNTRGDEEHCGSHAGVVDGVRPGGALVFREYRAGRVRKSLVDPARPSTRRDGHGRIINSFLRPKQPEDPAGTRYYAGEMLCAIARVTATR